MTAANERVHSSFHFFVVRVLPLPAAGQKTVDGIVHLREVGERVVPEFLGDPLLIQDIFDAAFAIAFGGGTGNELPRRLAVVEQMQLLEPTDSLFRVGRLFALLHQPLLQLPFGHTGRRDDPHGPRPGRSLPGRGQQVGTRHLISGIIDEISDIFLGMGYSVASGTEAETDYYNFEALNAPADHPSRGMQDTFYLVDRTGEQAAVKGESAALLRTQTSGVQVHTMEENKPPIYIIAPGKVYRRDVADPSHLPQFHQVEGLVVDKGISFGDLKGTLDYFCKQMFGPDRKTRFRAHYFPFTEPSAEADVSCGVCGGSGHLHNGEKCRMCKGTGWLEILGCGMVDPNVYGFVDIDPEEYSGFAFGMGVERIACLKYNVPDLRMLLEGDMRFLRQF